MCVCVCVCVGARVGAGGCGGVGVCGMYLMYLVWCFGLDSACFTGQFWPVNCCGGKQVWRYQKLLAFKDDGLHLLLQLYADGLPAYAKTSSDYQ